MLFNCFIRASNVVINDIGDICYFQPPWLWK